jgi:outer membrane protein assembly factor BamA
VLLAATFVVAAQEPEGVPRFFIDSISVEGVRWASGRVIVAETRLHAGREYSEPELRDAAARATRLPFVLRVEPRLEKGASRGAYRRVLAVTETRPLFFGGAYLEEDEERDLRQFTAGARRFLGRSGMLHGAATTDFDEQLFELGYTQYDLFGRGVFIAATLEYGAAIPNAPGAVTNANLAERLTAQVVAGVPLRGNQALRATYLSAPVAVFSEEQEPDESLKLERATTLELSWIYDSTDDPLFAARGTRGVVGAGRRNIPFVVPLSPVRLRSNHEHLWAIGDLRHVWSLAPRHAITAQFTDTWLRRDFGPGGGHELENTTLLGASYAYTIFPRLGDLRLEAGLVHERTHLENDDVQRRLSAQTSARLGLLFRNEWGVIRLRFDVEPDLE